MKACLYFAPKLETIFQALPESEIDTDNKAIRKSLQETQKRLRTELFVKKACLLACEKGFRTVIYLETRAKAVIEIPKEQKTAKAAQEFSASKHPEFHDLLKTWRNRTAETLNLPGHMVLPRRTLLEIAEALPVTQKALLEIKGMGAKKAKRFGAEILEMTSAFRKEHNMEVSVEEPAIQKSGGPAKGETQKQSYELFLSGKTVAEIAVKRKLNIGTIESHLSFFVGTGQLAVEKLVSSEKIARISGYFNRAEDTLLGPAKAALGDDVSYGEIKCVLKHLEYLQSGIISLKNS